MNYFYSIVHSPLFWIESCHFSGHLLITLKKNSSDFEFKKVSANIFTLSSEEIFCYSEHFVENEKDGDHSVQGQVNMLDGVEQTSLNPVFFHPWFLLNLALCYHGEVQRFSCWRERGVFFDFHTYFTAL